MSTLSLSILRLNKALFRGQVRSVIFPGKEGEFSALAKHMPLITSLKEGAITIRDVDGNKKTFPVRKGIVEIRPSSEIVVMLEDLDDGAENEGRPATTE